jgi:hypothetical protein
MAAGLSLGRAFRPVVPRALALVLLALAAACAAPTIPDRSVRFDATSDQAIVVLASSVYWTEDFRDPDKSLTLHWQQFDPKTLRLVPGGKGFTSLTRGAVRTRRDDPYPPAQVLQVEPGSYALVAAGSGLSKTIYVATQERYRNKWGHKLVKDHYIDPLKYIEPQARLAYGKNQLFSVEAGQIVYLGHFEFSRNSRYLSNSATPRRVEDEAAAQAALAGYPGISGPMIVVDPAKPPQSTAR